MILRTCFITKQKLDRSKLIRIYLTKDNEVKIGNCYNGRGFYLVKDKDVILKVIKNDILSKKLKIKVSDLVYRELEEYAK